MESFTKNHRLFKQSVTIRRYITETILRTFQGWGYQEFEVPLIDDFDTLKQTLSPIEVSRALRFLDRNNHVMMLRYDSTPCIAKTIAFQLERVFAPRRVFYTNKVIRIEEGRTRSRLEAYQAGVELIGIASVVADIELLCVCIEILQNLNLSQCQINITDHMLVERALTLSGAPARIRQSVKEAIISRDLHQARFILSKVGVREQFLDLVSILTDLESGISQMKSVESLLPPDPILSERIRRLDRVYTTLKDLGLQKWVHIDLADLSHPSYYDGFAFNIVSQAIGRSLGGGGRYDNLFGQFGRSVPAVGFALSTELLSELYAPTVELVPLHTLVPEGTSVSESELTEGFASALKKRQENQDVRIVVSKSPSK